MEQEKVCKESDSVAWVRGEIGAGLTVGEDAGFEKKSELLARVCNLRVGEIGVDKNQTALAERVGRERLFLGAE